MALVADIVSVHTARLAVFLLVADGTLHEFICLQILKRCFADEAFFFGHGGRSVGRLRRYNKTARWQYESPPGAVPEGLTLLGECLSVGRLSTSDPLAFGKHGAGLLAGDSVHQIVAEENLRRCGTGSTVLGDIVGTDVNGRGGRGGNQLDLDTIQSSEES